MYLESNYYEEVLCSCQSTKRNRVGDCKDRVYAKSRTLKRDINKGNTLRYTIAVTLAMRSHLFSYRTQKLSSSAPKILSWRRLGKIGRCCIQKEKH